MFIPACRVGINWCTSSFHNQFIPKHLKMNVKKIYQTYLVHLIFWTVIQARWSRTMPTNSKPQTKEILTKRIQEPRSDNFSQNLPILNASKLQKHSQKILETYCYFLQGLFKECTVRNIKPSYKRRKSVVKYHKSTTNQSIMSVVIPTYKRWQKVKNTVQSTTASPLISTSTTTYRLKHYVTILGWSNSANNVHDLVLFKLFWSAGR